MAEAGSLRTGVVGVGYLGSLHAAKYAEIGDAQLVAVYDTDPARAEQVAADLGCKASDSLEALLAEVDAVSVAVPTVDHVEVACLVAEAGIHMLIEKPLAADSAGGRHLAEVATRNGVCVQVGHLERFNPVFDDVHRILSRPRFIECHRLAPFAGRGVDTDVVFDVMIHDLDIIAFLVGQDIATVEAVGVPVLSEKVDIANARIRFTGGCIANITASRVSLKRERKLRVFQEDAYVSLDFDAGNAIIARRKDPADGKGPSSAMDAIAVEERSFDAADPLMAEIESFVACVRSGSAPAVGLADGLNALAFADRVVAALEVP